MTLTLDSLIALVSNRVRFLQAQRPIFVSVGDVQKVLDLDNETAQAQVTLDQLESLRTIS
jgi:hypothetical protein